MKSKFFFLFVLLMGFSAYTFAQSAVEAAPAKQDAPKQEMTKSDGCAGHQAVSTGDCKWVDADKDGICDTCGKKECGDKKATTMSGCEATCTSSSKAKSSCCSSSDKGGKK